MARWLTTAFSLLLIAIAQGQGAYAAAAAANEAEAADKPGKPKQAGWRDDLPWFEVQAALSSLATLKDANYGDYKSQCIPEFVDYPWGLAGADRSTYALIMQSSGLCLPHLAYAYDKGNPRPSQNAHADQPFDQYEQDRIAMAMDMGNPSLLPAEFDPADPDSFFNDPSNPSLDLPSKVLFPVVASDVIAAVNFANEHGLQLSVKNSGHSWQGASSKKDTLLINMNRYTHYAPTGIIDCDAESLGTAIKDDLSDQPCHLSVAKEKPGVIRVGGGENWDKTYRSVIAANELLEQEGGKKKYHVVGGSSGSVSPMGWTFQAGLSGETGGSKYGLGADQVVQIEMVLPNGFHVKFGPTEWQDASAEGFIVPKTTGVTGLCRSNPEEQDEDKWIWGECPESFNVDFMDLWYAVRGGGGGTWGVVLSMYLQLHDYLPLVIYQARNSEECLATVFTGEHMSVSIFGLNGHPLWMEFVATYMMDPSILNVSEEKSRNCSSVHSLNMPMCYGEEDVSQAWITFLRMKNITGGEDCLTRSVVEGLPSPNALGTRWEGHIKDDPAPGVTASPMNGILIPRSWVQKVGVKRAMDILGPLSFTQTYYTVGSAAITSDQANSVSQAHRDAGVMINGISEIAFGGDPEKFWREIAPELFDMNDGTNFPPIFGSNHAAVGLTGPRKDDWALACPNEWTFEERLAGCVSFQESIYGTETLKRLEAIKKVVDPNNMFECHNCVGNNGGLENGKSVGETADQEEGVAQNDKEDAFVSPRKGFLRVSL